MLQHTPRLVRHALKRSSAFFSRCTALLKHSNPLLFAFSITLLLLLLLIVNHYETKLAAISREKNSLKLLSASLNQVNEISDGGEGGEGGGTRNGQLLLPDDLIVIYNRVPKTASTSFMGITYELCGRNGFNVMHLNTSRNSHVMSLSDQLRFVWNVTRWTRKQPAFIHGHVAYLNFARFGLFTPRPLYINLIRRPLDRLVSYYYFLRNGDNFRPNVVRKKAGDKRSFDECVDLNERDCRVENLWLQVPFFCGQDSECWKPGSKWALETAKRNLLGAYFLVGTTESLHEFVQVLEAALPQMFAGATAVYDKGSKSHLRKTFNKVGPSARTIAKIQQSRIWQMENEFYQFALDNFNFVRDRTLVRVKQATGTAPAEYKERGQQFFFEKIRPK